MPTSGGPNLLGESNLIFAYDTGDIKNSYIGEPTTNGVGALNGYNPLDLYTWAPNGNTSTWTRDTSITSPLGGIPLKEVSSGTDSYSDTYNSSTDNIIAASSGQTWTVSVYALALAGTNLQVWLFAANSNGNYISAWANSFTATGVWQRISITQTMDNGSTAYIQSRIATSTNGGIIWWDGLQVEQKSHTTPFVNGTRSVTQGLLPLAGTSSINLTNISFDSNAQIIYDGTNDYIDLGSNSYNLGIRRSATYSGWIKSSNTSGNCTLISDYGTNAVGMTIRMNNASSADFYVYPNNHRITVTYTFTNNVWYNLTGVMSEGTMYFYINGALVGTNTLGEDIGNSASTLKTGTRGDVSGYFPGNISNVQIYNRPLSSSEIKQNYISQKSRFGL